MKQPDLESRLEYQSNVFDIPTKVRIPGTKKDVLLRGVKPYTLEKLTRLWLERDLKVAESSSDALKDACIDPYFSVKEALLFVLNDYWKIRLFLPVMTFIWGKVIGYTDEQMTPIIIEGKKKLPLMAHWTNMAYSVDMRTDWMKLTKKEAEQYRAEQISVANQLLSKNIQTMETPGDSSSVSS